MATVLDHPAPTAASVVDASGGTRGGGSRLLRFALANVRRRPERFVLSTAGIALAVMAVIVVRTIAAGYATVGSDSLSEVLGSDPVWVVGAEGVRFDPDLDVLLPNGSTPALTVPEGWTAHRQAVGVWAAPGGDVALVGRDDVAPGAAVVSPAAADLLGVAPGARLRVGAADLTVATGGTGTSVTVPVDVARTVVGDRGWWTVTPSAADTGRRDLGALLSRASGIPSTTDASRTPSGRPLAYDTVGGGTSLATFQQAYSAIFASKVTSSTLGLVSVVGLVLGFVIAVSSFLAAVQERRREFGIMSSIGLADEVLYFFLVESALVFVAAYAAGALAALAATTLVVPDVTTLAGWAQAAGIVAAYLPAMAIVGALVPVHRLLQQRPVDLLRDDA
ncbi:FtsX-like permease family protein [Kineosporia sp. A_224]|uniref:FtsX-like permease family protein n=1 Tax=Kineosporia sp. A_224 TaxID=1962180 RepID=UPI000B4C1507|nr:ABC transporter permease [Kineosporia sp. A_224]